MSYTVVCDSNIYRGYYKNIDDIKVYEERSNLKVASHPIVMSELLSHLADKNDLSYQSSKKAIYVLVEHTEDEDNRMSVVEDAESQISNILFGVQPELNKKQAHSLQITCKYVHDNFENDFEEWVTKYIVENNKYVESNERMFVDEMQTHVINYLNPQSVNWNPLENNSRLRKKALDLIGSDTFIMGLAASYVQKAVRIAGIKQISEEDYQAKILVVLNHFKTPLKLYLNVLKKIIESGLDFTKTKYKNTLWDLDISFIIGDNIYTDDEKILLITDDKDILRAAKEIGCTDSIMSFMHYRKFLLGN